MSVFDTSSLANSFLGGAQIGIARRRQDLFEHQQQLEEQAFAARQQEYQDAVIREKAQRTALAELARSAGLIAAPPLAPQMPAMPSMAGGGGQEPGAQDLVSLAGLAPPPAPSFDGIAPHVFEQLPTAMQTQLIRETMSARRDAQILAFEHEMETRAEIQKRAARIQRRERLTEQLDEIGMSREQINEYLVAEGLADPDMRLPATSQAELLKRMFPPPPEPPLSVDAGALATLYGLSPEQAGAAATLAGQTGRIPTLPSQATSGPGAGMPIEQATERAAKLLGGMGIADPKSHPAYQLMALRFEAGDRITDSDIELVTRDQRQMREARLMLLSDEIEDARAALKSARNVVERLASEPSAGDEMRTNAKQAAEDLEQELETVKRKYQDTLLGGTEEESQPTRTLQTDTVATRIGAAVISELAPGMTDAEINANPALKKRVKEELIRRLQEAGLIER